MHWSGQGLIIGIKKHGETSLIIEAMVRGKGRYMGLVRGGRSKRLRAALQVGNDVELSWSARLEEHLGTFKIELIKARAANIIADKQKLYLCQLLTAYLRLLPERDPHDKLLEKVIYLLDECENAKLLAKILARFEIFLLEELGFGLDLYSCALSGETKGLSHVSPKSGRAVIGENARPYLDKLLPLPSFLINETEPSKEDIANSFALSGHFLNKHIWQIRQINPPSTRQALIDLLLKQLSDSP